MASPKIAAGSVLNQYSNHKNNKIDNINYGMKIYSQLVNITKLIVLVLVYIKETNKKTNANLLVKHFNIKSLQANFDELHYLVSQQATKPDVIAISKLKY